MPRKSLTEGDSPRITLRMNNEIKEILDKLNKNERSGFIREAIMHYASSYTYRSKRSMESISNRNTSLKDDEKVQSRAPVTVSHKPAWQR